ncbi:hypothetical protein RJ640_022653 [Escallonia rubra]|uniref:Heparanase-like protein 3 n=1 Tax=Escallonia rubra TaxID=112253 RepID=A0AA88RJV5_9ASTE|nr:hypothetical protein RJ640_022653 [Escallonia rubra]
MPRALLQMSSLVLQMGFDAWVCFFTFSFICGYSEALGENGTLEGIVFIDGKSAIGITDTNFICATLDWWPPEKCDYGTCAWGHASLLNLVFLLSIFDSVCVCDLSNTIFLNAIKVRTSSDHAAFSPLKIRLGGTLQDKSLLSEFRALIIFGLNALDGRTILPGGSAFGAWDSKNAASLIAYTVKKGYPIYGWELGNELSGTGVGTKVTAAQYASDSISLQNVVQEIYKDVTSKPQIIAPGGFFDQNWFTDFVNKTPKTVDVVSHHIYNLGSGADEHLVERILDPSTLDGEADTFSKLQNILKSSATSARAWVGEAGGAYNSGRNLVTNAFVFSFWYLDQLGMSSSYDTKTYCRQSLIGGNYGLLNTTNFTPNPDYYSALLWHRLMGRRVLSTSFSATKKIRAYAHCAKQSKGITVLLINLDNSTTVQAKLSFNSSSRRHKHRSRGHVHRRKVILLPRRQKRGAITREEYHLTAKDGNLHSQTMLLNGNALVLNSEGDIPPLHPLHVNSSEPITIAPYSIVFSHLPHVVLPACS